MAGLAGPGAMALKVAGVARHLATEHMDPAGLLPLLNNWIIPLDKDPGACPVGIGEVLR